MPTLQIIRPNGATIRESANYNAFHEMDNCPSHGNAKVRRTIVLPSMMGYGTDEIYILTCGCSYSDTPLGTNR